MQKHVKCRDWIGRCNCLAYKGFHIPAASQVMLLTLVNRANCPTSTPRRHATCTLYASAVTSALFGAVKYQIFTALFPGPSRVDCLDVFSFFGAGCGLGLRSARGATKGSPSAAKEPLSRGQTLPDVTVLHAYSSHLTLRGSPRIRTMARGGCRCAVRHEPGELDLGIAWAGNAITSKRKKKLWLSISVKNAGAGCVFTSWQRCAPAIGAGTSPASDGRLNAPGPTPAWLRLPRTVGHNPSTTKRQNRYERKSPRSLQL